MKKAFTMIEIIFVLIILSILAGVAMPKLFANRSDALILKARDEVAKVNAALLAYGQEQMYKTGFITFPAFKCNKGATTNEACIYDSKTQSFFNNLNTNTKKRQHSAIGWDIISKDVTFKNHDDYIKNKFDSTGSNTFIVYVAENTNNPRTYYFIYNHKDGRLECVNPSEWTSKDLKDFPALECW